MPDGLAGNSRLQATRNYELGRKISYTNNDPVSINRVSVAVVLDDRPGIGEEPASAWSEVQINQIATLVRDAVGFNESRGDSVTVINNSFAPVNYAADLEVPLWQQSWLQNLLKQLAAGLFILLMVLGVLRPVLANLAKASPESRQLALAATQGDYSDFAMAERGMMDDDVRFSGQGDAMLAGPGSEGAYDRHINQVRGLVAEDPGRVAQVVKNWVNNSGR
jgi:flagellar M-ring protein FliF